MYKIQHKITAEIKTKVFQEEVTVMANQTLLSTATDTPWYIIEGPKCASCRTYLVFYLYMETSGL